MSDPQADVDMDRLKKACEELSEHFGTVHIFVTRENDALDPEQGTVNAQWGSGNWFARYGQIRDWLIKRDEEARVSVRKEEE